MIEIIKRIEKGNEVIQLQKRVVDGEQCIELIINGIFIMASYNALSSKLLVTNSIKKIKKNKDVSVLIGGLGMGYTVNEATTFDQITKIDVVEIKEDIINLNKNLLSEINGNCLFDQRVVTINDDFFNYISTTSRKYDIISMDIDNGPMQLVYKKNNRVYTTIFFKDIKSHLNKDGIFVVWSCNETKTLQATMHKCFGNAELQIIRENHMGTLFDYFLYFSYQM